MEGDQLKPWRGEQIQKERVFFVMAQRRIITRKVTLYWGKFLPFPTKRSLQNIQIYKCGKAHPLGRIEIDQSQRTIGNFHLNRLDGTSEKHPLSFFFQLRCDTLEQLVGPGSILCCFFLQAFFSPFATKRFFRTRKKSPLIFVRGWRRSLSISSNSYFSCSSVLYTWIYIFHVRKSVSAFRLTK